MQRRTKIVATLGPATDLPGVLEGMIRAGVDVVRMNLSHGSHHEHRQRIQQVRKLAAAYGHDVGILIDLQGPKIRICSFRNGPITLRNGDAFILDLECPVDAGDQQRVGITFEQLINDSVPGEVLVLADGAIELCIEKVEQQRLCCRVTCGGELSNNKGINKLGGGLSTPALTDKDKDDIHFAAEIAADYVAVSFVRSADDVHQARELLQAAGGRGGIVSKIERAEAITGIEAIIEASEAIMIARGDLGVEIGDAELPAVQKRLIKQARAMNRITIIATQMMESMIEHPVPTRAEVFDVANGVMDGTDAVMLSAETAAGQFPIKTVEAMSRICCEAEKQSTVRRSYHRLDNEFGRIDESIAMAAMYTANHLKVEAIAAWTETGSTPMWMSRISSGIPIYALTPQIETRSRVTLFRGVYPVRFDLQNDNSAEINEAIVNKLLQHDAVQAGSLVIITKGDLSGVMGGTNVMKIIRVGEHCLQNS